MEARQIKDLKVLRTYCDWLAHSELDRKPHDNFLISTSILLNETKGDFDESIDALLLGALRFDLLMLDINSFFTEIFGLPQEPIRIRKNTCDLLISRLIQELLDKPIKILPKSNATLDWNFASKKLDLQFPFLATSFCLRESIELGEFEYFAETSVILKSNNFIVLIKKPFRF